MVKRILSMGIGLILASSLAIAANGPQEMGDVTGQGRNSSDNSWIARFGHVSIYNPSRYRVLEATNHYPAIGERRTAMVTHNKNYWGARYGIGSTSQHYRAISYGNAQKSYNPRYTYSPYYREGKWTKKWKFSWRKGWYRKWVRQSAKFRCDSFVSYCYKKGTGNKLLGWTWTTTPKRVFNALPNKR